MKTIFIIVSLKRLCENNTRNDNENYLFAISNYIMAIDYENYLLNCGNIRYGKCCNYHKRYQEYVKTFFFLSFSELKNHDGCRRLRMLEMSAWLGGKPLNAREH